MEIMVETTFDFGLPAPYNYLKRKRVSGQEIYSQKPSDIEDTRVTSSKALR